MSESPIVVIPMPTVTPAGAGAPDASGLEGAPSPPVAEAQAANIATAKQMHRGLGYQLAGVGKWLYETADGAFESIEHAIEHIVKK